MERTSRGLRAGVASSRGRGCVLALALAGSALAGATTGCEDDFGPTAVTVTDASGAAATDAPSGVPADAGSSTSPDVPAAPVPDGGGFPAADAAPTDGGSGAAVEAGSAPDAASVPPAYALVSVIFGDMSRTTYVSLFESLDISTVDLKAAREYPGIPAVDAADGKLFVFADESARVTRFSVAGAPTWTEEGRVDFSNYGLTSASRSNHVFLGQEGAYQFFEVASRIVWDRKAMQIQGMQAAPASLPLDVGGLKLRQGYQNAVRGTRAYQPFYRSDTQFFAHGATSQIAVYDAVAGTAAAVLDAPCPGLQIVVRDEADDLYFSNSTSAVIPRLFSNDAAATCMVRIRAGQDAIDSAFKVTFAELTGGREAGTFTYLGKGRGFVQVFHKERITITPDLAPFKVSASENWRLWVVDLDKRTAAPMEGLDYFGGQYYGFTLDGRTFVLLPASDYKSTTAYEITSDGKAVKRFESPGWAYQLLRVR